jgi:ferredoxin-NADP reductase
MTLSLRVAQIIDVTPGIREFVLHPVDGATLPPYVPGSHLVVACGGHRNAYSLTGDGNAPDQYSIGVLKCVTGKGGSEWMHALQPGQILQCDPPRSAFPPIATARHHLLIAGGIGITPFLSHLRAARRWGRSVTLLYAAGGPVPFAAALADLTGPDLQILSNRTAMQQAMQAALGRQPLGTHLYVCGPPGLMQTTLDLARALGWPEERCHAERFAGVATADGAPFTVHLRRSGRTLDVPSGRSLLEALEEAGLPWPAMCRQGVCGECRMDGAHGTLLHRDFVLSAAERAAQSGLMPCVSRAEGLLTLDL